MSSSSRSSSSSSRSSSSLSSQGRLDFNDIDVDQFTDAPWDRLIDVSVSILADEDVILGNPDGTFAAARRLNRAEFVQIIMRLTNDDGTINLNCFPDVRPSDWYADPVCRAKALGFVRGNAVTGVAESMWKFEPTREVQYEEAVKVLIQLYALPIIGDTEGADWYVPYLQSAEDRELSIAGLSAGDRITRGEMARLVANFLAFSTGQLDELHEAQDEDTSSSSRSSSSSSTSKSSSSKSSSSKSSTGSGSGVFDPDTNRNVRASIMQLGEVSPVLAGVRFFSNNEPVEVERITINLTSAVDSIESFSIYDANGQFLGTATDLGGGTSYRATIANDFFELPRREDKTLYIRARLKEGDSGGESGEEVRVDDITLEGNGSWSNDDYTTTTTDTFEAFQTAYGTITSITHGGDATAALTNATEQLLADFDFTAESTDNRYDVRVNQLRFTIEQAGGITLSNVFLKVEGSDQESSCSVAATTVTCGAIPAEIGTIDGTQSIRLYGDVSVPSNATNPRLRLVLNEPGSIATAGSITWSDGVTTFSWLPFTQPVVRGTQFD